MKRSYETATKASTSSANAPSEDVNAANRAKDDYNSVFFCAIFTAFKIGLSPCHTITTIREIIEVHFPGLVKNVTQSQQCNLIRTILSEKSQYYQRVKCTTFKPGSYGKQFYVYAIIIELLPELKANCNLLMYEMRRYFIRVMRSPVSFRWMMKCPWLNDPEQFYPGDLKNVEVDLRFGLTLTDDDFHDVPGDESVGEGQSGVETESEETEGAGETKELNYSWYSATDPGVGVVLYANELPLPEHFYCEEYSIKKKQPLL